MLYAQAAQLVYFYFGSGGEREACGCWVVLGCHMLFEVAIDNFTACRNFTIILNKGMKI